MMCLRVCPLETDLRINREPYHDVSRIKMLTRCATYCPNKSQLVEVVELEPYAALKLLAFCSLRVQLEPVSLITGSRQHQEQQNRQKVI